jgi:hypothetical protein
LDGRAIFGADLQAGLTDVLGRVAVKKDIGINGLLA